MFPVLSFGQDAPFQYFQNISTDSNVRYRLFATRNKYHFIKLDTRNGLMRQVQWNTESGYNFSSVINDIKFANSVREITELKTEQYKDFYYKNEEELELYLKPKPLEESIKRALETYEIERNGRFFLYPTQNMYNFILLDQIDGRTWQVQWNIDKDKRGTWVIY